MATAVVNEAFVAGAVVAVVAVIIATKAVVRKNLRIMLSFFVIVGFLLGLRLYNRHKIWRESLIDSTKPVLSQDILPL